MALTLYRYKRAMDVAVLTAKANGERDKRMVFLALRACLDRLLILGANNK